MMVFYLYTNKEELYYFCSGAVAQAVLIFTFGGNGAEVRGDTHVFYLSDSGEATVTVR